MKVKVDSEMESGEIPSGKQGGCACTAGTQGGGEVHNRAEERE